MAMGTKKEAYLTLAVLVVALTSCLAKRPMITVVGGGFNGRFNFLSNVDIFRVVMPDRQACPTRSLITTAFDWKVLFTTYSSKPDGKICVDFGHLKLTGDSTKFTVNSRNSSISDYIVTPSKYPYPQISKSMSTVKCYEDEDEITLMFHSDCDGNLKDYFSSWTDVYYHPFWDDSIPDVPDSTPDVPDSTPDVPDSTPDVPFVVECFVDGDGETITEWQTFIFNGLFFFFKILAPFALLIGVCSCYCIYRRQAHKRQAQFPVAPYAASVLRTPKHMPGSSAPAPQSIAMQPLMVPGNNAQSHTSYPTSIWVPNGDATKDRIAATAPPPSYTDVTSGGSQPHASPRPPYAASTELPPPPFFASPSALPAAPPAYNDLFPSNT
ncbi:hypothetical protein V1264_020671 [Littorina saxatilis]|uniref:Uncharacterized protein n=1 Tax=Littorina saxatilis TaxID=31220 RepID=A0AAN9BCA6_9CAEN